MDLPDNALNFPSATTKNGVQFRPYLPLQTCSDASAKHSPNSSINSIAGSSSMRNPKLQISASCTGCRRRKVKCDRTGPCGNCLRSGIECVPYIPSRGPRGRQGGRKKMSVNTELQERIATLEGLVRDIASQGWAPGRQKVATVEFTGGSNTPDANGDPAAIFMYPDGDIQLKESSCRAEIGTDRLQHSVEGLDRYLGTSFWVTLSEEINCLRDVLNDPLNNEADEEDEQALSSDLSTPGQPHEDHSGFVISRLPSIETLVHPTPRQVYIFCDIYLSNVDPVFKVLHTPSLRRCLQDGAEELDCSPGLRGLEALKFAIYYAATGSITDEECKIRTGEDKAALLARYRNGTEVGLAKADFVNTTELSTLQALTIYLATVRAHDSSRLMWTLVSLAVRIAQAMGLHDDYTLRALRPFDREMRRRLWWQICVLDSHAAEDRASNPVISADSFDTKLPLQIDDKDLFIDSSEELKEQDGFTDMTLCLLCQEVSGTIRQLNQLPSRELRQPQSTSQENWSQRIEMVINLQRHIDVRYLRHLDMTRPFHWMTRMVADVNIATVWLFVYRPFQRRMNISFSPAVDPGILRLSVDVLEKTYQITTDPAASPFRWLCKSYVQWHALAVTIAELCVITKGPIVERAWVILEHIFRQTAQHVADSRQGLLWRPIKKLMNNARRVRQNYLVSHGALAGSSANSMIFDASNHEGSTSCEVQSIHLNGYTGGTEEEIMHTVNEQPQAPLVSASVPFDWDEWSAAAETTQSLDNGELIQMASTNWEDFLNDFQTQESSVSETGVYPLGPLSFWQ